MYKYLVLATAFFALAPVAQAEEGLTGNSILNPCKSFIEHTASSDGHALAAGFCGGMAVGFNLGYLAGQHHGTQPFRVCFPSHFTHRQTMRVFIKFLEDHPEKLHGSADVLYGLAMHDAFPCPADGQ